MARTSNPKTNTINKLRDLSEISKTKVSNVIYEATNNDTVSMNTDEASRLIGVINAVLDDCFTIIAARN